MKIPITVKFTCSVPEFIDPVFAKTSSKRSFSVIENERLGLENENWVYKFGHRYLVPVLFDKIHLKAGSGSGINGIRIHNTGTLTHFRNVTTVDRT
jgi:hypothetical protein